MIVRENVIKSDEPVLIDGMQFDELKAGFDVPVCAADLMELVRRSLDSGELPLSE